jgi:hypothetical protein
MLACTGSKGVFQSMCPTTPGGKMVRRTAAACAGSPKICRKNVSCGWAAETPAGLLSGTPPAASSGRSPDESSGGSPGFLVAMLPS